jgi:lysophospholipase L1-like esterase
MRPSIELKSPAAAKGGGPQGGADAAGHLPAFHAGWAALSGAADHLLGRRGKQGLRILIYAALFSNARFFLGATSGVVTYLLVTGMLLTAILAVKEAGELTAMLLERPISLTLFTHLALVATSVMMTFVLLETFLQIAARFQNSDDNSAFLKTLAMPPEWEKRPAQVEGDEHAYYWHNALHVHNRDRMRRVGEFPPKLPGTLRIIVLGDSLTYGYGIAEEDTYVRVLERELRKTFRVEVLNLGVSGSQSEDVHKILRRHFPILKPDLVVYGVCLNDFLPSGVGQYESNRAYPVPIPYKEHFIAKTLTGKLLDKQYDALLMRVGLRVDFFTDILRDFNGYQTRFARDVKAMNDLVRGHGLPPVLAMVLDQYPNTKEDRYEIVVAAEKHLRAAGIRIVASDYIRLNDGRMDWRVSPWEGHPNERANKVFAQEIAKVLRGLPELQPYRRHVGDEGQRRRER